MYFESMTVMNGKFLTGFLSGVVATLLLGALLMAGMMSRGGMMMQRDNMMQNQGSDLPNAPDLLATEEDIPAQSI